MDRSTAAKGVSIIQEQHDVVINVIEQITAGDYKVLVLDENSKKIIDNVVKEDDILRRNIANIERIEERRELNPTMDAIYILSPLPHIVDCLLADFERRRYKKTFLVWTSVLEPQLRRRIDSSKAAQQQLAGFETLSIDFFPRETHVVTFRDPWSFPVLFHPACNNLVRDHMQMLAQRIAGVCITLGEYPNVRYYKPRNPTHEASVLCGHLARFVQQELDEYGRWNPNFPPPSNRPQGALIITDRSMDLMAPIVHEFTYQAMAHDLLTIRDEDKVTFHMTINEGTAGAEKKDMELAEKDEVWVKNRHRHMKDTIDKLMGDFQDFLRQNPNFTNEDADTTNLNAIRDMLAGLPQFQEMKEAYSLHLTMAQESMNVFQKHKLPDVASVEQTLATGLDEDGKKPKNILDQVVRLLDDDAIGPADRLRLIMMYVLWRDGVIPPDIQKLLAHSSLPPSDGEVITNLEQLGAQPTHALNPKEVRPPPPPLFPRNPRTAAQNEEYALSRFEPAVKTMLQELCKGTLDPAVFPYVKPPMEPDASTLAKQGSLRAAKPNWAGAGRKEAEKRQRIIVYMAGGATYSEARSCYEVSDEQRRDVFLATSHMVTPQLFLRQVGDLSVDKRRLDLPMERPKPRAPAHLFERPAPPMQAGGPGGPAPGGGRPGPGMGAGPGGQRPPPRAPGAMGMGMSSQPRPPVQAMGNMSLNGGGGDEWPSAGPAAGAPRPDSKGEKEKEHKKKRNIFGIKK